MKKIIVKTGETQHVTAEYTYEVDVPKSELKNVMTELSKGVDPYDILNKYVTEMIYEEIIFVENDERWTEEFYKKK